MSVVTLIDTGWEMQVHPHMHEAEAAAASFFHSDGWLLATCGMPSLLAIG